MRIGDRLFHNLDNTLYGLNELFAQPANTYCRLDTSDGEQILVANDSSMVSVIELHGLLRMIGVDELKALISRLDVGLKNRFINPGHLLQVVMQYDPDAIRTEIHDAINPSRVTANNLGLDVDWLLDDWEKALGRYCAVEHVWLVLWTRPFILPPSERADAGKEMGRHIGQAPRGRGMQTVGKIFPRLSDEHKGALSQFLSVFRENEMVAKVYSAHEALWWVRHCVDPEFTGRQWRAVLPGDRLPLQTPVPGSAPGDLSSYGYPSVKRQVFPRAAVNLGKHIQVGDRIHAPLVMNLPPQSPKPFNSLFKDLVRKGMPWRASFLIDPGGLGTLTWKSVFAAILRFASDNNRKFMDAKEHLEAMDRVGHAIVRFRASFDTWVPAPGDDTNPEAMDRALKLLKQRSAEMAASIQAWGSCDTAEVVGDPLLSFSSTVPCLMPTNPAPGAAAPLLDILGMMPLTRPSSAWRDGSVLLRSPDGKLMPYTPGSSLQKAWIELGLAPMGSGKSVLLNLLNLAFILQPGLTRLPWLSIMDIGPSSSGLIALLKALLPQDKSYLAAYHRLRMTPDYAINPFDTPLGCRKPLPAHKNFLVNLLSLFATPLNEDAPQDGVPGIARAAVELAYDELSPERNPRLYNPGVDPVVDQVVQDEGLRLDARTSWWEIVDMLFAAGRRHEAVLAQRYAVPLLSDVAAMARRPNITSIYKHTTPGGEPISDFFWRACIEAISAYPILQLPTRFDIGDAQIVSLDLDEVAPKGGPEADRQTGVMYMLGRHVIASRFFMAPEDVKLMPETYRPYHSDRIDAMRQDPKRFCCDEVHRVIRSNSVAKQFVGDLETSSRESRKWNLHLALYTQKFEDIPPIIMEMATSVFILGAGTEASAAKVAEIYGMGEAAKRAILNLGKPGRHGANMLALFDTSEGKMVQVLTNTLGDLMIWGFSSTSEDAVVRKKLYERLGTRKALETLSSNYPGGIKQEAERRKRLVNEKGFEDSVDVLQELANELEALALAVKEK